MRRLSSIAFICAIGTLSLGVQGGEKQKSFQSSPVELKVFELTNQERKKKDIPLLKLSPVLSKVARAHSENMARQLKMEHKLDDKTPFDRLKEASYDFLAAAENIAMGDEQVALSVIMQAWMDSKDHRANILNAEYTEIGIGIARDKTGRLYYTQVFGRPQP